MSKAPWNALALALLFPLLGCQIITGAGTPTSTPPAGEAPSPPATQGGNVPVTPALSVTETSIPTVSSAVLWVKILSPLDGAVVDTPQIEVLGSAPADTVITMDDQILIVGADGQFRASLSLDEGPNVIEIVASDAQGHEVTSTLTVTYEP